LALRNYDGVDSATMRATVIRANESANAPLKTLPAIPIQQQQQQQPNQHMQAEW